jgi:ribonuclease P protein component
MCAKREKNSGRELSGARLYSNLSLCHVSHEAHLSAEEAQAVEDARIPRADADARRSADDQTAAGKGSQAADGVSRFSPGPRPRSRRSRLSHSADFERVLRQGRSHGAREMVLHAFPRGDSGPARLGLSVSRKVGGAVDRNRVKRLLREAFMHEGARLPPGTDVVLIARRDLRELAARGGLSAVRARLAELISQVDGARPEQAPQRSELARGMEGPR